MKMHSYKLMSKPSTVCSDSEKGLQQLIFALSMNSCVVQNLYLFRGCRKYEDSSMLDLGYINVVCDKLRSKPSIVVYLLQ